MSEEVILQYVKSIDTQVSGMRSEIMDAIRSHVKEDDDKHDEIDMRLKSLETSRTAARAGLTAIAITGTGGAAKLGLIDKIISIFGGSGT